MIEEQFFKTFGIEKQITCSKSDTCFYGSVTNDCYGCYKYKYPEITAERLLELIAICNKEIADKWEDAQPIKISGFSFAGVKESILQEVILLKDNIKAQVRKVFEGE